MRVWSLGVLPLAVLAMMAPAKQMRADTVFSNFGPAQTYKGNAWWKVGAASGGQEVNAFPFTPTESAMVTGADLALAGDTGTDPLIAYIETDTGSGPGTILDTLTQVGSYASYPVTTVVNFACTGGCSSLTAGTQYWLVAQATNPSNDTLWLYNNIGQSGTWYYNFDDSANGPWTAASAGNTFSAFDVTGSANGVPPVPEPASLALLGSGLLSVWAATRRKLRRT